MQKCQESWAKSELSKQRCRTPGARWEGHGRPGDHQANHMKHFVRERRRDRRLRSSRAFKSTSIARNGWKHLSESHCLFLSFLIPTPQSLSTDASCYFLNFSNRPQKHTNSKCPASSKDPEPCTTRSSKTTLSTREMTAQSCSTSTDISSTKSHRLRLSRASEMPTDKSEDPTALLSQPTTTSLRHRERTSRALLHSLRRTTRGYNAPLSRTM